MRCLALVLLLAGCLSAPPSSEESKGNRSVRLFGTPYERNGIDRVWIPAEAGTPAGGLGSSTFTIEMWIKLDADAIAEQPCIADAWWKNQTMVDREFFEAPMNGDLGLGVWRNGDQSGVVFGFEVAGESDVTLCGDAPVADDAWHHVAAVRYPTTDQLVLYVDGVPDESKVGPAGDGSVSPDADTDLLADLYMVLGGGKHGVGAGENNFVGWIDDLRLSQDPIYVDAFEPPTEPLQVDASTTALYSFDEGEGVLAANAADPGNGDAELRGADDPDPAPAWSDETPHDSR